ncbi:Ty3/Gypsy family RNase HI domain-containing protein, partial [Sodalis sp.]|uniref:Ty3/Gypsy family RNase HI domain-containing protein n=1 Tax=Sodalis sp. (in: enterobacteria) TaxID=1898979 RepID=UPI0038739945
KFLGHIISERGVKPDPSKIDAIVRVQPSANQKELRSFLGMVNYYRKFLPNVANIISPLIQLLKKGIPSHFCEEHRDSFRKCKQALTEEPVLMFPDFRNKFLLTTDASEKALGAVLSQESGTGDRPVAFASRQLTDAESRYSALERELLAIVWAVEHFRPYVFGRKFTLRTDHKPLLWTDGLKESSARVGRWKEKLRTYNFQIVHQKGSQNVVADWLSRALYVNPLH